MAGVLCVDTVYSCCTRRFQLLRLWIDEIPEVLFTIQCNTKHHPSVVLLIMLYEVVLTFESVDEILWCGRSNESYWAVLSCGAVYYAVQGGSYFWVCGWNSKMFSSKWKLLSSTVAVVLRFILLYKVVLTFESVDEIPKCSHPNESYLAVLLLWYCSFCCTRWFLLNVNLWMKS